MIQGDTPPSLSDMDDSMEDDAGVLYAEDLVEVIDASEIEDGYDLDQAPDENILNQAPNENILNQALDVDKRDATYMFTGHSFGSVFCGSLNKNGTLAITGGEDDKAYIWNTKSGDIIDCIEHKDSVIFTEFNFDETYLATGDMSGLIKVYKLSDKMLVWQYNMGDATWMKWHMAANVLFAGSVDGEVYVWKIPDGDCKVLQGYGCRAETGIILPDGKRLAVGYEDGTIRVMDLKTCSVLNSITPRVGHSSTITALDCHSDNSLILSAAVDGKTILSTSHSSKVVSILQALNSEEDCGACTNWVETASFCKDPGYQVAATGTLNGEIFIWDITNQVLRQEMKQEGGISKLVWKQATSLLFSAGLDGILRCYDTRIGECIKSFAGHTAHILDLHVSDDGSTALTTSDDSTAMVFDISSLP